MLIAPLTVHFEVTNHCNNHCPHCYASSWIDEHGVNKIKVTDVAVKIAENNVFDVVITGGEPLLLNRQVLIEIFQLFQNKNINFSLNTNGRLLNKKTCQQLKNNGLKGVLVSLHSWDDNIHNDMVKDSNAAKETKQGIMNALDHGLRVSINQVIGKKNITTMVQTAVELEKMGATGISFSRQLSPLGVGYNLEMIEAGIFVNQYIKCKDKLGIPVKSLIPTPFCSDTRIKSLKERLNCTGGLTSAAISCFGDVRFCPQDPQVWGNICEENMSVIWKKILKWRNDNSIPLECKECSFLSDCRGGCRVAAKVCTGSYKNMDPWATEPIKNYIRKVIYRVFNPKNLHMLHPEIRFRNEKNSVLLYCQNEFINVNPDAIKLISSLPNRFVPEQIIECAQKNSHLVRDFLELLYQKGFLFSLNEGG